MRGEAIVQKLQQLQQKREEILSKIKEIEKDIKGTDKILEALKNQRWYFFKNKKTVLFDKNSGLLWANLNYFPYGIKQKDGSYSCYGWEDIDYQEWKEKIEEIIAGFDFDGVTGFRIPDAYELWNVVKNTTIPFHAGNHYCLRNQYYWYVIYQNELHSKDLDYSNATYYLEHCSAHIFPCSSYFIDGLDYQNEVINTSNSIYTEKERLQHLLDIFVNHELQPIFND